MHFVPFLLFGMLIGLVARMVVAGRGAGWAASVAIGGAGAMVGAFIAYVGRLRGSGEPPGFVLSLLVAFVLVALCHAIAARRKHVARLSQSVLQ